MTAGATMNRHRAIMRRQEGTSVVEFALVLPLLVLLLAGIVEFGLIMYNQQIITNASREGARYGIVLKTPNRYTQAQITSEVQRYCGFHLVTFGTGGTPLSVSVVNESGGSQCPNTNSFGQNLRVTVSYNYTFLLVPNMSRFFGTGLGNTLTLTGETLMKCE